MQPNFEYTSLLLDEADRRVRYPNFNYIGELYTGVDLGTAYIVLYVVDSESNPVVCDYEYAKVVRDGVVVDFSGARYIVKRLKEKIEQILGTELRIAAGGYPPKTGENIEKAHKYICESVGFEVVKMIDEPTAANNVLSIKNGAIVDVGGGTTGIAIVKDGKVIYTDDEPTGGTHLTLVIAGAKHISFEEAEEFKKDPNNRDEVIGLVKPVIQKIGSIIMKNVEKFKVDCIYMVGGTCCLKGIEDIIAKETGIKTWKPDNPMFVTPLGIAISCNKR